MPSRRRGRIGRTGCLFWLFILLIVIVVFIYRGRGSLKETISSIKRNFKKTTEEKPEIIVDKSFKSETPEERTQYKEAEKEEEPPEAKEKEPVTTQVDKPQEAVKKEKIEEQKPVEKLKREIPPVKKQDMNIYFVMIDSDNGKAFPVSVSRSVSYGDSPITKTIEALLTGPSDSERKKGIISFIPEGTRLISANIREGHLTLNFSSQFEENYSGREAVLLELQQIMLTSFEFEQVAALSILIENERKRYLTGEGIPLREIYTEKDISVLKSEG